MAPANAATLQRETAGDLALAGERAARQHPRHLAGPALPRGSASAL